jgi:hypothetical protein
MTHNQRNPLSVWAQLVGLVAVLILGIAITQVLRGNTGANVYSLLQTAQITPVISSSPPAPFTPTDNLAAKETLEFSEAQTQAALLQTPSPAPGTLKPTLDITPEPVTTADIPRVAAGAGWIVWGAPPPFPASQYFVMNQWYEIIGQKSILVYAGAARNPDSWQDVSQGIVIVVIEDAGTTTGSTHKTPTQSGPVHVTDAVGERLILQSDSGVTYYFDVPSRQFVDSLTATPAPTATEMPTPTPVPLPTSYPLSTVSP